jgi:hypothetical protein
MLLLSLTTLITGMALVLALPHLLLRSIGWLLLRGYSVRIEGADKLPLIGPGILVVDQDKPMDTFLFNGVFSRFLRYVNSDHVRNVPGLASLLRPVDPRSARPDGRASGGWYHKDEFLYWAPEDPEKSLRDGDSSWESLKDFAEARDLPLIPVSIRHGEGRDLTVRVKSPREPNEWASFSN